jgi:hypothetical protein
LNLGWADAPSYSFGTLDAALNQSTTHTFTLRNTDGHKVGPITITLSGSGAFTKTADGCTGSRLTPKKSCTVTVKYAPTQNGAGSGLLTASSPGAPNAMLGLTGTSTWSSGDITTYDQLGWDQPPGSNTLTTGFGTVYGGGSLLIGGTYQLAFTDADAVLAYIPSPGAAGPLTSSLQDPINTASGTFGGDVLALQLDVDFADAGVLGANSGLAFGDLTICGLTSETALNGTSVRDFLAIDNVLLGSGSSGGFTGSDITNLDPVTADVAGSFNAGTPSTFAQDHLVNGSCA